MALKQGRRQLRKKLKQGRRQLRQKLKQVILKLMLLKPLKLTQQKLRKLPPPKHQVGLPWLRPYSPSLLSPCTCRDDRPSLNKQRSAPRTPVGFFRTVFLMIL